MKLPALLPWCPLETLAPGRTMLYILTAVSAVEFLRFCLTRRKRPQQAKKEEGTAP